jgi:hypothetical protein
MREMQESNPQGIRKKVCKTRKYFNFRILVLLFRRYKLLIAATNVTSATNVTRLPSKSAKSTGQVTWQEKG